MVKAQGKASLSAQVSGQGVSQAALVSSLSGQGELSGADIILEGFDVARFARSLSVDNKPGDTVSGSWKTSTKGGTTKFDTLNGRYNITKGVINLEQFALDGETAAIQSKGTISLPKWYLDTKHSVTAKGSEVPPFMLCLLYTSPSPRDQRGSRMPSSA